MQPGHLNKADQQSNEDAVLYDRYGFTIFSYVRLHTASREDAEDLTLEVFAAALERDNLRALSEQEQLAWLRRVAHNKLVDGYRRVSRHTLVAFDKVEKVIEEYGALIRSICCSSKKSIPIFARWSAGFLHSSSRSCTCALSAENVLR